MNITYIRAKNIIAITGDYGRAWEIAKQDEGLLPSTTKESWIAWAKTKI